MPTWAARGRARPALARLARADMDNDTFRHEAIAVLRQAIGFDWWCWTLLDPATRLPTRGIGDHPVVNQAQRRFYRLLLDDAWDPGSKAARRAQSAVRVLSTATGGDMRRERCWREMLGPGGTGDILQSWLIADRTCWALVSIERDSSGGWFGEDDAAFVADVSPLLATRDRNGLRTSSRPDDPSPAPGTIIVDNDLSLVAATGQAWRWIDRLGMEPPNEQEPLPGTIYAIATRVAAGAGEPPRTARVPIQAADGGWVVIQVAALTQGPPCAGVSGGYAITLEGARSDDLAPLLMRAWGLSPREREVARLVIDGLSTEDIAAMLFISQHTVHDHLKVIFDKLGVHRRRDLVAALAGAAGR